MLYRGKAPQKSMARAIAYSQIEARNFFLKKHIVIASQECGDIQWLLEHNVKKENIIACDIDPEAISIASKYGVIISPCPDIVETFIWSVITFGPDKISSINIDLCHNINFGLPILQAIKQFVVSNKKLNHLWIFFTFFRGRDGYTTNSRNKIMAKFADWLNWIEYQSYRSECYGRTNVGSPMCLSITKGKEMTTEAAKKAWKTRRANEAKKKASKKKSVKKLSRKK